MKLLSIVLLTSSLFAAPRLKPKITAPDFTKCDLVGSWVLNMTEPLKASRLSLQLGQPKTVQLDQPVYLFPLMNPEQWQKDISTKAPKYLRCKSEPESMGPSIDFVYVNADDVAESLRFFQPLKVEGNKLYLKNFGELLPDLTEDRVLEKVSDL